MAAAGVPMRTLQEWMGHRDQSTTQRYADYAPSSREAEMVAAAFERQSRARPRVRRPRRNFPAARRWCFPGKATARSRRHQMERHVAANPAPRRVKNAWSRPGGESVRLAAATRRAQAAPGGFRVSCLYLCGWSKCACRFPPLITCSGTLSTTLAGLAVW